MITTALIMSQFWNMPVYYEEIDHRTPVHFSPVVEFMPVYGPPRPTLPTIDQRVCMYMTLYGEARSESNYGQQAIATVIMNRVASPKFPNTVCGVVQHQRRKGRYQFETWNPNDPNYIKMHAAYEDIGPEAMRAMSNGLAVLEGATVLPSNALNYHTTASKPIWRHDLTRLKVVDNHVFYGGF